MEDFARIASSAETLALEAIWGSNSNPGFLWDRELCFHCIEVWQGKEKDFCKVGDGIACLPWRGAKSRKGKDTAKLNGVVWSSGSRRMSESNFKAILGWKEARFSYRNVCLLGLKFIVCPQTLLRSDNFGCALLWIAHCWSKGFWSLKKLCTCRGSIRVCQR